MDKSIRSFLPMLKELFPHVVDGKRGIKQVQLPHLGDAGTGIHRKLPHLGGRKAKKKKKKKKKKKGGTACLERTRRCCRMNALADRLRRTVRVALLWRMHPGALRTSCNFQAWHHGYLPRSALPGWGRTGVVVLWRFADRRA